LCTFVPTAEDKYKGVADVSPHSRPPSRSPSAAALKAARHSLVVASKQCVITPPHPLPLSLAASTIIAESFSLDRAKIGKHIVGHPLTYSPTMPQASLPLRAQTLPSPSHSQPESIPIDSIRKAQSAPSNPTIDVNATPDPAGFHPPDSPNQPPVSPDLENGSQTPIARQHWWQRKRSGPRNHSPLTAEAYKKSASRLFKEILCSTWVNILLVFIPVGIALHFVTVSPTVVFVMNFLAIVPLAGVGIPCPHRSWPFARTFHARHFFSLISNFANSFL